MFERVQVAVLLTASLACGSPLAPDSEPTERFGSVTALIGGHAWTPWPTLQFIIPQNAAALPYHLGDLLSGLHGEWFNLRRQTRARELGNGLGAFVSTGGLQDSLIIEQLDLSARTINARFHFTAQEVYGHRVLSFVGRVSGRIILIGQ